jgi:putative two-component system response regulator
MHVLTVDDDPVEREILNYSLREVGHEVQTAENGREAMEIMRASPCRMVITDWQMPLMDGLDLCRAIRAEVTNRYVYIIMLTGRQSHDDAVEGLTAGADDYIAKPFHPGELAVRVRAGERILGLETRDLAIFTMAKLFESRDPETGAHLDRVRDYCLALARGLQRRGKDGYQMRADEIEMLYRTCPLHDIGKTGIPDGILLKPGRLSDREFEIMKDHTTIGAQALDAALTQYPNARFLRMARDIAATHHECMDGTGYPAGLSGQDIPLCGRIVAVADVYDALVSKRVYKSAYKHEVSRSIITEESGMHFDPEIVAAFLDAEQQFVQIQEQYPEVAGVAA